MRVATLTHQAVIARQPSGHCPGLAEFVSAPTQPRTIAVAPAPALRASRFGASVIRLLTLLT